MSDRYKIIAKGQPRTKIYQDGELKIDEPFVEGRYHDVTNRADGSVTRIWSGQHADFDTTRVQVRVFVTGCAETNAFSEMEMNPLRALGDGLKSIFGH